MVGAIVKPNTTEKLQILSVDAQYDLACACNTKGEQARMRGDQGNWIYPVSLPNGGQSILFKTLMSNACQHDCKYCPLREQQDVRRCSLSPDETAAVFMDYFTRKKVFGLFLSSAVLGTPDRTMDRLTSVAEILRRCHGFRGYIHLKVIPGASHAAIERAVSLSSAVSLNMETPGQHHMAKLSEKKNFIRDIVEPIKLISRLTAKGSRHQAVRQTTQFIVGAAGEADVEIVKYMGGLYDRLAMSRIFFSAYQQGLGDASVAGASAQVNPADVFVREHRLYQVDFLMRTYGFAASDIVFEEQGDLSLQIDPKENWAIHHPEQFPMDVNRAARWALLRVPGLGPVTVRRILKQRRARKLARIEDLGKVGVRLKKAEKYLCF